MLGDLLNTKMPEEGSVVNHVLKLMECIQEFKDNSAIMGDATQVNTILRTFPRVYNQFLLNYTMNDKTMALTQLLHQLRDVEDLVKQMAS